MSSVYDQDPNKAFVQATRNLAPDLVQRLRQGRLKPDEAKNSHLQSILRLQQRTS